MFRRTQAPARPPGRGKRRIFAAVLSVAALPTAPAVADSSAVDPSATANSGFPSFEVRSLDGGGNNRIFPRWGQAGTEYIRVGRANYADGRNTQVGGPPPRYTSNRVFNDVAQNIFSERGVSQWGWTWGQFMDHVFGLAQDGGESSPIAFNASDPLESFTNGLGSISFTRDQAAPGSGSSIFNPREHINTLSSYIDAFNVYGGTPNRLEWLRSGVVDGDMSNNDAKLLLTEDGYLPRATARGDAAAAPQMATDGQLASHPQDRAVAGDVRANENMALTGTQTLFAREHNRIVDALEASGLSAEQKFQIARRVVGAEQQFITYNEFLPAMGVSLPPYSGYKSSVNSSLSTEFATVGYRAHSQIHGEFEIEADLADYTDAQLDQLRSTGVEVILNAPDVEFVVPLEVAFFNPDLVNLIGEGPIMKALSSESQYKNDEQIDNALRSILFQVPGSQGVADLGALDVQRGRDHGVPKYNALRRAYGLPAKDSFRAITGENTQEFPAGLSVNNPSSLDFTALFDRNGDPVPLGSEAGAVRGVRRTALAARLKGIYGAGNVDNVEAFVGAYSEPHVAGTEMGELNLAIWRKQFTTLRDGDRFFYANDSVLPQIEARYGITFKHTLSELIALNTDEPQAELPANVFFAP